MNIKTFDSRPVALPIKKIVKENETTNTYVFEYFLGSKPGQFVMMWIPGVDEKPFSIAFDDGNEFWLTICNVGPSTEELFKLKEGDKVEEGDVICTLESMKMENPIMAPVSGVINQINVSPEQAVKSGENIAVIEC